MIARGSTRLTVPVMSSPSRLANWSKTWSALDLADALQDDLLGRLRADPAEHVAVELLGLDQVAKTGVGLDGVRLLDGHLGELVLDLADHAARAKDPDLAGLGIDPDVDILVTRDAPTRTGCRPRPLRSVARARSAFRH